jgi:hypothetical protein
MLMNCLRHPLRTLSEIHASLIHRTITANLEQAHEHATNGNREGFERHCAHAGRLAQRHAPDRMGDVERVAAGSDLLGNSTTVSRPETTETTANA